MQSGQWRYKAKNEKERKILERLWTPLGKTDDDAYKNFWPLVGSKIGAKGGMDRLWKQYKTNILPRKSVRTQKDDEAMWKLMEPMFRGCHPSEITRQFGIEYLTTRGNKGIMGYNPAPSRAIKEYALLRHMLNMAVDWGIIDRNPLLGVRVKDYVKVEIRTRAPEVWELIAVKKHSDVSAKLFIDFKYMTGMDQSTAFSLPIPSFDGPGIPIQRSKTNKKGYIEWSNDLIDLCRELIAYNNNRCAYLFCNTKGNPVQVDTFGRRFKTYVTKAIAAGDLAEPFTPNDIRSGHGTDAEELYGLDATSQLLNSEGARKHYVHKRKGEKITPLPRPNKSSDSA
ncbi:MAG: tyrosine-type recombinase/integrase [Agarilytica sp.]